MKQLIIVVLIVLASCAFAPAPVRVVAATESGSVTGTGGALFDAGAALGAINLDGLELGTGVFIEPNGSATGVFHAVLAGRSLLGQAQRVTLEGTVNQGTISSDGLRADFSGIATVDLGDGTAPLSAVPFSVSTTAGNVVLAIESTTLPAAGLTSGAVTIE
jgi:hypothetical protein